MKIVYVYVPKSLRESGHKGGSKPRVGGVGC